MADESNKHNNTEIIAEAGVNHNGNPDLAHELVDAAAEAGADAVKFQTFDADRLATTDTDRPPYQEENRGSDQRELLSQLELDRSVFENLQTHCSERNIEFLSTPYGLESVQLLSSLGVERYKIASADIVNKPLLSKVGTTGKPVILSSGMATLEEIARALQWLAVDDVPTTLLHCVSDYPASFDDLDLRFIETLDELFDVPVGYSDHTMGIEAPVAAVVCGAKVIEKHLTLDQSMDGPDHESSIEPDEFDRMVDSVRRIERGLGDAVKSVSDRERANAAVMRPSIHAGQPLEAGDSLTEDTVTVARPADGLEPSFLDRILGARVNSDIQAEEPITWDDIQ